MRADYARFVAAQPAALTAAEQDAICRLATDIPAVWQAPTTTAADRPAILRQLIERVVVTVQGETEQVDVPVHWLDGYATQGTLVRPVARLDQLSYYPQGLARASALQSQGHGRATIAQQLNAEGWRPAKRCETFNAALVGDLLLRQGRRQPSRPRWVTRVEREADEWTLTELVAALDIPLSPLHRWLRGGQLQARPVSSGSHSLWLVRANAAELERLRQRHAASRHRRRPDNRVSTEAGTGGR